MVQAIRFFVISFVVIICLSIDSSDRRMVLAQDSDTNHNITPIPHAEVLDVLFNFKEQATTDCVLPCFNEIRPEQTTLSEIQTIFTTLFDGDEKIITQFNKPFNMNDELQAYTL